MFKLFKNRELLGVFDNVELAKSAMYEDEADEDFFANRDGLYIIRNWWPLDNSRHGCFVEFIDDTDENDLHIFPVEYVIAKVRRI